MLPVICRKKSENKKTGPVAATYVSQATCPATCPLLHSGCYAEKGPMLWGATSRVNRSRERRKIEIAKIEARLIEKLPGDLPLRVHVVGDASEAKSAQIVGSAMVSYVKKHGKAAWTYTHAWKTIKKRFWKGASVIASCDSLKDVKLAKRLGWATAVIVEEFKGAKAYVEDGIKLIPCPYQTKKIQCVDCKLCLNAAHLKKMNATIAFEKH